MSVSVWQDELALKTYLLGPEDPLPHWERTGMSRIYPYTMQDNLTEDTRIVPYQALHVENEFLHALVLPELGGHLYSLYDKVANREVFYRNNVVKYGLVARRGAWLSGGIEFNFPQGHTCVTVSPVPFALQQDEETGEGSITVGCTDRVSRMRWSVKLSLAPGEARLRQDVMLHNPRPYRQRHYFWANSAVPATDDLHLVFPARRVRTFGGEHPYPIVNGRDMSYYRNHERPNDIFALDVTEDFFGCYYEDRDVGMVHWSNHHEDFGKKFFTWGTADEGMIWVDLLTDSDGQYVEMQSGRFVDQSTFEFLYPYQTAKWTEYWYPLRGMGGFVWANEEAAVNLQVTEGEAQVAALVNRGGGQGELVLQAGYQDVWRQPCELRPGHPVQTEAALPATGADGLTLSVVLEGKPIISYEHPPTYQREPACEMPRPVLRLPDDAGITVEELCQHAVRAEKVGEVERARAQYERALRRDPGFSGAHLGLGVLSHQAGRGDEAPGHLVKAVERDPENDEAWYCLGVALLQGAELQAGQEILGRLVGRTACRVEAALSLARSLVLLQPERALALASQVPDGPTARLVRAQVYRLQRRAWGPEEEGWEKEDPLDAQLAAERYFRAKWLGDDEAAQSAFERLAELCGDDPEAWLEILCEERDLGAVRPLGELLAAVCDRFPAVMASPMVHYCLPTFVMPEQAEEELDLGARGDLANCFPSRFEEWMPLFAACDQRPSDWRPRLLLGNLMAGLGRREEALAAWQDAARLDDSNAVLCRNLALAYRLWHNDLPASLDWYAKAVARRPDEYHLYLEQDQALIASGATPEQRLAALEAGPPEVVNRWETAARRTECLVALQRWDEALELLPAYRFKPWEGARQMHGLWVAALTGRAERHRAAGDLRAAVADYELALTYPRHLGVGCAAYPQEAKLHWMVAETAGELGDEPKRQEHLSAAAEEKHQGLGEADLYKLRALRALDRSAEADELAAALKEWAEERLKARADDQTAQQVLAEL